MANRYWVPGGTNTWNTTSTANWSAFSGGATGASVPTAADSVFFDQAGTYTVTCTGALTCLDITVSAGTVTFANGTTPTFTISGSMSLVAGTVWSTTGAVTFNATTTGKTITTNGTVITGAFTGGPITFSGAGGGWTLGSAFSTGTTTNLQILQGTFDTNNYNVTVGAQFVSNGTLTRSLIFGSSTITAGANMSGTAFSFSNTNITLNAGTSSLFSPGTNVFAGAGLTFYNITFTATTPGTYAITGANTFNNFTVAAPSATGVATVTFDSPQTINGTLSTTGTAGNRRVFFASATYGISQTLTINSVPNLTDADFRGLYVTGTAADISGTRIGNRGECRGIAFSAPKTVYWNLAAGGNWSANAWATSSGGAVSTDNFPLPQDTATIVNTGLNTGATLTFDNALPYVGSLNMSGRTLSMTFSINSAATIYGDWINGSGTVINGSLTFTFSGGGTQTITSAGKTFTCPITIDTYGGTVQLADALNIGTNNLTVTNGTFDTAGYSVTADSLVSNNSNIRAITLRASTLNFSNNGGNGISVSSSTNLTLNAGTSQINFTGAVGGGLATSATIPISFYNLSFTGSTAPGVLFSGAFTCNNLTFTAPSTDGLSTIVFSANVTVNGTLTCAGASAVRRIFLQSNVIGTQRDLTVGTLSANDCDFRDIEILGTASGTAPTRAGNCGNNAGITFPSPKTVYWNLAGTQNWSATGWATSSGGSPAVNNFPLAQDTAVFDNTGSAGTVTFLTGWNIGTFDASGRTSAMTLTISTTSNVVYGDWKFGTGVTSSSTSGTLTFSKNGTSTITSNGVQFGCPITINHPSGTVQLADALSLVASRTLTLTAGTFDAVTYNVTLHSFSATAAAATIKMGSGTWSLSSNNVPWTFQSGTLICGTSTIVLTDTSTNSRTFNGGSAYYNKLTIGGTTGTSTLSISGANTFGELASTKTVAHTIALPSSSITTIGKWSVTGTSGNVVTVGPTTAAATYTLVIAGPANTGIDYLSVSYCAVSTTSPGEFYVGANSTNTAGNTGAIIFTATPSPRTLYWRGGTGNWSATTSWDTVSGGAGPAAIPTSLDAVVFNSASNATAYTATIDAGVTIARCASFTMAGPLAGNVTFAGTVPIAFHGNVSFAATGITRSYTGAMSWAGNSSYTFTTNGLALSSACTVIGVGSTWTLGSPINTTSFTFTYGAFSTSASNHSITSGGTFASNNSNVRSVSLNGSTLTLSAISSSVFSYTTTTNLSFNAGTSQINLSGGTSGISSGGLTFYNVSFTNPAASTITVAGANTFNTLSFAGQTTVGIVPVTFTANQTISTLTLNAGTAAAYRTFLLSNTIGTQRTLSVGTLTAGAADYDFRDIAITGAASPIAPTRAGDCKGNSGITFPAAKTVYFRTGTTWGASGTGSWSLTNGGAADATAFPLAQDTAIIPSAYPVSGGTVSLGANYNIGTIDMSARTSNTLQLSTAASTPTIYGNWINGTGVNLTGTGTMTFAGRGSQTITSAGKTFQQPLTFNTPGGSVTLQDAFTSIVSATALTLTQGTFDAGIYSVTFSGASSTVNASGTGVRTLALGSGTWTVAGSSTAWTSATTTNLTITGTGTISMTSATAKTFTGGGANYSGITLNQGGAGALTISGNNTFKDITNTYSATGAATISLGTTNTTLTQFTGTGAIGKVLTLSGTSAASPATLILTSGLVTAVDYLSISIVRAYSLSSTWYAGANSTNLGSLGWYFSSSGTTYTGTILETSTATDLFSALAIFGGAITETSTATDTVTTQADFAPSISETATGTDSLTNTLAAAAAVYELATGTDTLAVSGTYNVVFLDTPTATDAVLNTMVMPVSLSDTATATDAVLGLNTMYSVIAETGTATDALSAQLDAAAALYEVATATDAISPIFTFNVATLNTATATDALTVIGTYNVATTASATVTDATSGAFLWNPIDDSQIANWQNINNAQTPGWGAIDDSQDPDWTPVLP